MCSGQGNFEMIVEEQHKEIFKKFEELIQACETNFKTEEEKYNLMCPHHKNEHETFIKKIKELQLALETHIEVHDKGLINKVCTHTHLSFNLE
jgi:hemerythrin